MYLYLNMMQNARIRFVRAAFSGAHLLIEGQMNDKFMSTGIMCHKSYAPTKLHVFFR